MIGFKTSGQLRQEVEKPTTSGYDDHDYHVVRRARFVQLSILSDDWTFAIFMFLFALGIFLGYAIAL
jgi:hypothetical protein